MSATPRSAGAGVRRAILGILGVQLALAALLAGSDLAESLPRLVLPSPEPSLDTPVRPGDQVRRFRPRDLPSGPDLPGTPADMPERLRAERAGSVLTLTGRIAPGDADRLAARLAAYPRPETVRLNSPGGSVGDALALGRALRESGAATEVADGALCLSACPYLFAGGTERRAGPDAYVGVHQHSFDQSLALPAFLAVEDIQAGQAEVLRYLVEMGVDPRLMGPAMATPADEIYLLLPEELDDYRLTTEQG